MQFLFVVLMSVLMGASALPHLLQAPNRPSFSLRKNTAFSLVAIPKFIEKVASLEKKLAILEAQQKKKLQDLATQVAIDEVDEKVEVALAAAEKEEVKAQEESEEDRALASYKGPKGRMQIEELELKNCVCVGEGMQSCKVWVEGYCSQVDEYVSLSVKVDEVVDESKNLRCKDLNRFSGYVDVRGNTTARVSLSFRDQLYKRDLVLTNNCGLMNSATPSDDE